MGDPRVSSAGATANTALNAIETPSLSYGAQGPAVEQLQRQLNQAGYKVQVDGDFGPKTEAAVRDFQKTHGIAADGIAGPRTSQALASQTTLSLGAQGPAVEKLQQQLNQAGYHLAVDGDFGPKTEAALRDFQKTHGLAVDGVAAPQTARALAATNAGPAATSSEKPSNLDRQLSSIDSPLSIAIGVAEGNRTVSGAKTGSYGGHQDPVNHQRNVGNFSLQHATATPAEADQLQLAKLRAAVPMFQDACKRNGLNPNDPLLQATFFDLYNQSEKAVTAKGGFLDQMAKLKGTHPTAETLTKARIDSWRDPATNKFDHSFKENGIPSDAALLHDQRRRMGCLNDAVKAQHTTLGTLPIPSQTSGEKIGLGSTGPEVKELKQALKDAGFYQGPINDKMGTQGMEALKKAKKALDIPGPANLAGPETLKQIREHASTSNANVPFISQFDPQVPGDYEGQSASLKCDNACELMMAKAGVRAGTSNAQVIEFHQGGQADRAAQYLDQQLQSGRPVMIGVHRPLGSPGSSNVNGINHYLVATGTGVDEAGRRYIKFHDPAQTSAALGSDTSKENRLYLSNGSFRQDATGPHGNDPYELRGVVRNMN